jgi:hypothetical protein
MRTLALLIGLAVVPPVAAWAAPARAQVTEAERAAARELFKQGDELQRAGKFAEALDKFQRAQQIFSAPTNLLRIAECDGALGRLVESAESYRILIRTPLPAGSPPAFLAAVDQARAELTQIEPRVPKVVVQVAPAGVTSTQMQIDGQTVPPALIGESIPLDPGTHKILVFAPGYVSSEQAIVLKEHDARTVTFTLKPISGVTYSSGGSGDGSPTPPPQPTPSGAEPAPAGSAASTPPPPPPIVDVGPTPSPTEKKSRTGLLIGGHVGWGLITGSLPTGAGQASVDASSMSSGGVAYAIDGGLRFARQWYLGVSVEHASFGKGSGNAAVSESSASTTLAALVLGIVTNPDRAAFYGEIGLGYRWYNLTATTAGVQAKTDFQSGELALGAGLWLPAGQFLRLVPKATLGLGTFDAPGGSGPAAASSSSAGHTFVMLGMTAFYNANL